MGLSLAEIGKLLDDGAPALPALIEQQIAALEQEVARARELQRRLSLLQVVLAEGGEPALGDWLDSLAAMNAYAPYFDADELRRIFDGWKPLEAEWPPLVEAVRRALAQGLSFDSLELQPLVRRWMDLSMRWMDGDVDLVKRWGRMHIEQTGAPLRGGVDRTMLKTIQAAIRHRIDVLGRHLSPEEIGRLDKTLGPQWQDVATRGQALLDQGVPPESAEALALARQWQALLERLTGHDAGLRDKVLAAYAKEPLLQAGSSIPAHLRDYLVAALQANTAPA
jgi:hypothetical protein